MTKEKYNPKKEIEKISEKNKIWLTDKREAEALEIAGFLPLVHKELLAFLKREKKNGYYILSITDPNHKEHSYPVKIKYEGNVILEDIKYLFTEFGRTTNFLLSVKKFVETHPIHYDKYKNWWVWNKKEYCWKLIDETDILNALDKITEYPNTNPQIKNELLEAFRRVGRLNKPKDAKESWIQFKDKIYDIETDEEFKATSDYFITNPLNWKLGENEETPEIDKLFVSWVGEEHKQELYEILAFCIIPNYFIHRIICFIGSGANGKGTYLKILKKFIGKNNSVSTSLDRLLTGRFESSKLLKKLICLMGETNFNTIKKTELLKCLTGEDTVGGEFKNKDPFDFENYAKLIIATNSLPMTWDKTEGYYRRWKIIEFNNKFLKEKDVISKIPKKEYNNLAAKCLRIAKKLWNDRIFTNDGSFEDRKKRYEEKSNPIMLFIKENYEKKVNQDTKFSYFCDEVKEFLINGGYRELSDKIIRMQLKEEGFTIKQTTKNGETTTRILDFTRKNTSDTSNTSNSHIEPICKPSIEQGVLDVSDVFDDKIETQKIK